MEQIVWFNGRFQELAACRIAPGDRGFTLADGVFDTMLAVNGEPIWDKLHYQRLQRHAAIFGIHISFDFCATARALLKENGLMEGRSAIRTTVTRGPAARGLTPPEYPELTIIMTAAPVSLSRKPVNALICESIRRNEFSPLSRIKSLNYGDNLLALMQARSAGADDAIMLNTAGNVCCATTSNIFIGEGDRWVTPPLEDGVLDGILRAETIRNNHAQEESITPERLLKADTVFLTNSITGIRPVSKINDTVFPDIEIVEAGATPAPDMSSASIN